MKIILDLCCGSTPYGTINLDLFMGDTPHQKDVIFAKYIPNFINGDAQNIPLRKVDLVYISHGLEHLPDPDKALRNISSITDNLIVIVPNNPPYREHKEHLYSWSQRSLHNLLKRHFSYVKIIPLTRLEYVRRSRLFYKILRFPTIGSALSRVLLRWFKLELFAICKDSLYSKECDMFDSKLCWYYQALSRCNYKNSRNVKCVIKDE